VFVCIYNAGLYGSLFGDESEAAFSNYKVWESLGFFLAFAYSFFLCTSVKLYVLTSVLIVGICGYLAVEYVHWNETHSEQNVVSPAEPGEQPTEPSHEVNGLVDSNSDYRF